MKTILVKLSLFIITIFAISACQTATYIQDRPLLLSNGAAGHFVKFLKDKSASEFYIDTLGYYSVYYYCKDTNCRAGLRNKNIAACERDSGSECGLLATKHSIHWKNAGNFMPYRSSVVYETYGDYFFNDQNASKNQTGSGRINFSNAATMSFLNFLTLDKYRHVEFFVSADGKSYWSSNCGLKPECTAEERFQAISRCEENSNNSQCFLFSNKKKILWQKSGNFMPFKSEIVYKTYGHYFYDE